MTATAYFKMNVQHEEGITPFECIKLMNAYAKKVKQEPILVFGVYSGCSVYGSSISQLFKNIKDARLHMKKEVKEYNKDLNVDNIMLKKKSENKYSSDSGGWVIETLTYKLR